MIAILLEDSERMARFQSMLSCGLWYVSDYSGYDSPREAMRILWEALERCGHPVKCAPQCLRACDIGSVQQEVLGKISTSLDGGASCVFHDISDRLSPDARAVMQKMTGQSQTSASCQGTGARDANQNFTEWLRQAEAAYNPAATSWCLQSTSVLAQSILLLFCAMCVQARHLQASHLCTISR